MKTKIKNKCVCCSEEVQSCEPCNYENFGKQDLIENE